MPFANISLWRSGSSYTSYTTYTNGSGAYGFGDVPAGTYTFTIWYSQYGTGKSYFPPDDSTVTVASSGTVTKNASFLAATKTVSGKVTLNTASGSAITDANIYAYKKNGSGWATTTTDSTGNYSLQLTGGAWVVYPSPKTWPAAWTYPWSDEAIQFAQDSSTESKTKNFTPESINSTVTGKITLANGSVPTSIYSIGISFSNTKNQWYSAQLASDGTFSAKVTAGTYSVSGWVSTELAHSLPKIDNFSISADATKDLGTIKLIAKTDKISGTVTDSNGAAVAGAYVSAWKNDGGYDWGSATSGSDGTYQILVVPGTWQVSAWPQWKDGGSDYVTTGKPSTVVVASGVTSTKNFSFQRATNTLNVTVTDPSGNVLADASSWLSAGDGSQDWGNVSGTVTRGVGKIKLPKGTWTVKVYTYGGDYSSPDSQKITFEGDNETKSATFSALKNNATITGTVYDESNTKVTGKWLSIYATKGKNGSWQSASFDQSAGTYSIKLSAGTWKLGWWIDQALGYSAGSGQDTELTVLENETKTYDIHLKKANATIKGRAFKADGNAMQWAWITADTRDPNEKKSADNYYYSNGASSNASGDYELKVPAGTYFVGGNMWTGSGYINPKRQKITVEADKTASLDLTFRTSDGVISGTVTRDGTGTSAYVTAWAEDGGYAESNTTNTGGFDLAVSKGTTWHLRAIVQDGTTIYKSKEAVVNMDTGTASQDLALVKQTFTLPKSQIVTFDATLDQTISLDDGATLTVPANSIANSGTVTLTITPDAVLPEQGSAKPISYGYDLKATGSNGNTIEQFNSSVTLETPYTSDQLNDANVINAEELQLGYYDKAAGVWHEIPNCTVNTKEKKVVCQFNHFTQFALITASDTTAPNAPTQVKATAGTGIITVSWTKPTDADFKSVKVYRSTKSGTLGDTIADNQTGTSYEASGLSSDMTYYFTLKSVDTSGNESASSTQVFAKPNPATLPQTGKDSGGGTVAIMLGLLAGIFIIGRKSYR